jgi:hypothetical protein
MKILLYDVESFPNLAWIWGRYEQDAIGDMKQDKKVVSFSWKWLGEKTTHWLGLPSFHRYKIDREDNGPLVRELLRIINMSDVAIGHNIDSFDDKMSNTEFFRRGKCSKPHKTIDTLKIARKFFKFDSNKLDDLCAAIGVGRKIRTGGFDLWKRCIAGDRSAWSEFRAYNMHDVDPLLEGLFLREREWILKHQVEWKRKKLTKDELGY